MLFDTFDRTGNAEFPFSKRAAIVEWEKHHGWLIGAFLILRGGGRA